MVTKVDMLKDAQECIDSAPELEVVNALYDCLEKYAPYITLHFEWECVSERRKP